MKILLSVLALIAVFALENKKDNERKNTQLIVETNQIKQEESLLAIIPPRVPPIRPKKMYEEKDLLV